MRIINPASNRPPPMECYWLLAPECEGGMCFIPNCWGGAHSGPDGCFCRYVPTDHLDERIAELTRQLALLRLERRNRRK